ncbi:DUF721 domain-containing protein [Aestuariibius insulae]|uniref:DUF721 domain-containing protein n=1 Tax=Aestuariibius insulae TaxID=2058287 RepID=UPI00345F13BF
MTMRKSSTRHGFARASGLVQGQIRRASETRGFAVAKLLTHWAEVVGPDLASKAEPVKVSYGKGGIGGTLTVLVKGSLAPIVEMEKERIRERVNACYGYGAIKAVRITQTAPHGFAEAATRFDAAPLKRPAPDPTLVQTAERSADGVDDPGLRGALEKLALNVLSKTR